MLVVSRTEGEAVALPDLDVSIRVLRVAGSKVRIGVEAPEHIRVLRSELTNHSTANASESTEPRSADELQNVQLRSRIQALQKALAVAQKLLARGETVAAEKAFDQAISATTKGGNAAGDKSQYSYAAGNAHTVAIAPKVRQAPLASIVRKSSQVQEKPAPNCDLAAGSYNSLPVQRAELHVREESDVTRYWCQKSSHLCTHAARASEEAPATLVC